MLEQADVLDWDGDSNTSEVARSWYRANALGSILRVEEPDRTEAVSYRYDPYGEVTITRGGSAQGSDPLGQYVTYTGRWRDEEMGLYHYRARAYDAARGRFLQRDPLMERVGSLMYTYAASSPESLIDPLGLEDARPAGPAPVQFKPGTRTSPQNLGVGGSLRFRQSLTKELEGKHLWVEQEVDAWLYMWRADEASPSYVKHVHAIEYFSLTTGGSSATSTVPDSHNMPIPREIVGEGYCAYVLTVFAKTQTGTLEVPTDSEGKAHVVRSASMTTRKGALTVVAGTQMGDKPNLGDALTFHALTQPTFYTYTISGNWCGDGVLSDSDWARVGKCDGIKQLRPKATTQPDALINPTPPSWGDPPPPKPR